MFEQRLKRVEEGISRACRRAGRSRDEITLVAVTKVFPASAILEAYQHGLRDFGENYVQEFAGKAPVVNGLTGARFHLIGHLQSNKANRAIELFNVIQTVDSEKLAHRLNAATSSKIEVMVEVKLSQEETKHGSNPEDVAALAEAIRACPHLHLTGLMTMPPWSDEAEPSRPYFQRLRALAEANKLPHLSMGMSHDYEVAIEEGATHIRIGTALFGSRKKT